VPTRLLSSNIVVSSVADPLNGSATGRGVPMCRRPGLRQLSSRTSIGLLGTASVAIGGQVPENAQVAL
jgi:hypothetical protein